jgi:hypothetical protein
MPPRSSLGIDLALLLLVMGGLAAPAARAAEPTIAEAEFFEKDVRPLLVEKCWECHGDAVHKGRLKLTSRANVLKGGTAGPAAVPGKPLESLLVDAVRYQEVRRMPPGGKLTDRQIEVLERWVKLGVPWPGAVMLPVADGGFTITEKQRQFWAFQPVKAVSVPAVHDKDWPRSDIDRFILAALEGKGIAPARPADKRTLLRRATFDLTGLPPTPAEADAFLSDESPQAFAKVVDRLLASPRYGERWGRHWLDVVRYADARDLIQLPADSDFREAWRYRDWVVEAFNRDLPYQDFVRLQVAGDLLPPPQPGSVNKDGLVATGMLAIADFIPGDVDKEQMIADYVNDQIDVVGRTFLGLTIACARCHDHKFDPIGTEDYYALSGIFFSTRIIPGPVAGNTPLIRVPLLSQAEIAQAQKQDAADKQRRAELEEQLSDAADREYLAYVKPLVTHQTGRYLVAAGEYRHQFSGPAKASLGELAKQHGLQEDVLAGWVAFLGRVEKQPPADRPLALRDAAAGKLAGHELEEAAGQLQQSLAALAKRNEDDATKPAAKLLLARAALLRYRADDPQLVTDSADRVTVWPSRFGPLGDATPLAAGVGPVKTTATIDGHTKTVLRFDGNALLEAPRRPPPAGSLFVVFQTAAKASPGRRLVGWEDSDVGKHGLGLLTDPGGLQAILRNNGRAADVVDKHPAEGFETVCITWGPEGSTLHRNGAAAGANNGIDGLSSDPSIATLKIGGPGSGNAPRFRGDVAEIRAYHRQLDDGERRQVEAELHETWFQDVDPKAPPQDPVAELYDELLSPRGPFGASVAERSRRLPAEARSRLSALSDELEALRKKPPFVLPQAVVVQDGGPKGTRHEGFQDAQVFLRGDPKKLGKTVPRGFPRILAGEHQERITAGSGRLQLADWLARADNPVTARVMVNRIWQHHFGEGLVRTPNDFGERGERPTHPELLDYLATRFVESGWSVKAMHRLLMLSSVYQQSGRTDAAGLTRDPENRLFGRRNRRRLEAEAIRDSLLAVAGRLDNKRGGPCFTDLAVPRRTLYLQSSRTGANTSDFGRLFDRADPGSIVAQRGQSVAAPQALFFLNDKFVSTLAHDLASRVVREAPPGDKARIRYLYAVALGRPPTWRELDLGVELLAPTEGTDSLERYCQLIFCTNEFLFID